MSATRPTTAAPTDREPLRFRVADLIDRGLISAPARIFGYHSGRRIEARLAPDGTISYRGQKYASPSVAAGRAITAATGFSSPGRAYLSINGWLFWHVTGAAGKPRTLAEIRNEIFETRLG